MVRLAFALCAFVTLPAQAGANGSTDQFAGDQILYELTYAADFQWGLVADLVGHCTDDAAPFFISKLPNASFQVKQALLGGRFGFIGFISPNPYTGTRLPDGSDPRRPSTASQRVSDEMFAAAEKGETVGYLCDVRLWDLIQDYASAHLALVNYAVDALQRKGRTDDVEDLLSDVGPIFDKMERLVNGDPNRERRWRYELPDEASGDAPAR